MRKLFAIIPAVALLAVVACENDTTAPDQFATVETASFAVVGSVDDLTRISGGGQLREGEYKISFGGFAEATGADLVVEFHNVSNPAVSGGVFEGSEVTGINFFEPNTSQCVWAMNVTVKGTFNGEPGATLVYRAGDAGNGNENEDDSDDTVRFTLNSSDGSYDTSVSSKGDFPNESDCVGTVRTGLDAGNIMIK